MPSEINEHGLNLIRQRLELLLQSDPNFLRRIAQVETYLDEDRRAFEAIDAPLEAKASRKPPVRRRNRPRLDPFTDETTEKPAPKTAKKAAKAITPAKSRFEIIDED